MGFFEIADGLGEFFGAALEFFRDLKENVVFSFWVLMFFLFAFLWFAYLASLIWVVRKIIIFIKWVKLFVEKTFKAYETWILSEDFLP